MMLLDYYMNLSVRTKMFIFTGCFSFWLIVIAAIGLYSTRSVGAGVSESHEAVNDIVRLEELNNEIASLRLSLANGLINTSEDKLKATLLEAENRIKGVDEALKTVLEKKSTDDEVQKKLAALGSAWSGYRVQAQKLLELEKGSVPGNSAQASAFAAEHVAPLSNDLATAIAGLSKNYQSLSNSRYQKDISQARRFELLGGGLAVFSIVLAVLFSWLLTNCITKPLVSLSRNAQLIAEGDLRIDIKTGARDEIGQLAESFNLMVNSLKELLSTLADSSSQVSDSSGVILASTGSIADKADNTAAQTTAVAVASEEMSATSGDIAQNCQVAAESALRANDAAMNGSKVVENTIVIMQRIAERVQASSVTVEKLGMQSDQIGSIIGTIEDIADQTNLLALNAAIEAARAGEQGRGFAVVADEVRALAERTSRATREIGNMIKSIQTDTKSAVVAMEEGVAEVEQGTQEAALSGEALRKIREEINSVNMQVQQIATAAEQQTATTCEISSNIHRITDVVKNTSDNARHCVSISRQLSNLSTVIKNVVGKFTFSESKTFFNWNSSYSVGCEVMDQEHRRMVEMINNLYGAMRQGKGNEAVGFILDGLLEYTTTHFAHEERLMREAGYAACEEHKQEHGRLTGQVMGIRDQFLSGSVSSLELMSFVKDWLANHIQGSDKLYGPCVSKHLARR